MERISVACPDRVIGPELETKLGNSVLSLYDTVTL